MKDINFNDVNCSHNLASGLAQYSANCSYEDSKRWSLDWIKTVIPEEYDRLKGAKDAAFSNRGFVCRMEANGLKITIEQRQALVKFFKAINTTPKADEKDNEVPKAKKVAVAVNQIIYQLEDVVDDILSDKEPNAIAIPADKKQVASALAWIEKEIIETTEQVNKHTAILDQLEAAYVRLGGIKDHLTKPRAAAKKTPEKSLNITKAKAIKSMNYLKEFPELGLVSLSPAKLVGAKKALLYNTKLRVACLYVAKPDQTLTVSGSSIRGADEATSYAKILRKPADFFAVADKIKAIQLLNSKPRKLRMLVSDAMMIIAVA